MCQFLVEYRQWQCDHLMRFYRVPGTLHLLISFLRQVFAECSLQARHCSRSWTSVQKKTKPCSLKLTWWRILPTPHPHPRKKHHLHFSEKEKGTNPRTCEGHSWDSSPDSKSRFFSGCHTISQSRIRTLNFSPEAASHFQPSQTAAAIFYATATSFNAQSKKRCSGSCPASDKPNKSALRGRPCRAGPIHIWNQEMQKMQWI